MKKHHWFFAVGGTLTVFGGALALVLPVFTGAHAAGIVFLGHGLIEWATQPAPKQ